MKQASSRLQSLRKPLSKAGEQVSYNSCGIIKIRTCKRAACYAPCVGGSADDYCTCLVAITGSTNQGIERDMSTLFKCSHWILCPSSM